MDYQSDIHFTYLEIFATLSIQYFGNFCVSIIVHLVSNCVVVSQGPAAFLWAYTFALGLVG